MSDLISRQAAIKDAESWVAVDGCEKHMQKNVVEWLKEFPSAHPKRGKWRHYEQMLKCSECGSEIYDEVTEYFGDDVPHFCPNCGADMREVTT